MIEFSRERENERVWRSLAFSQAELDLWADHHRGKLPSDVQRVSPIVARMTEAAGVGARELLDLSARVIHDPAWNVGFLNRCAVIIRDTAHPEGRLGVWVERGALCLEADLSAGMILVIRAAACELIATRPVGNAGVRPGAAVRKVSNHAAVALCRSRVRTVSRGARSTTVGFGTRTRAYSLSA